MNPWVGKGGGGMALLHATYMWFGLSLPGVSPSPWQAGWDRDARR